MNINNPRYQAKIVPFSETEAIIEPFWDRHLSGLPWWQMEIPGQIVQSEKTSEKWWENIPGSIYIHKDGYIFESDTNHALRISQTWCNVSYEWFRKPADGCALKMRRIFNLKTDNYDTLLFSMTVPYKTQLKITIGTADKELVRTFPSSPTVKKEYSIPLEKIRFIESLTMELITEAPGPCRGVFNWIGLQDSQSKTLHNKPTAPTDWVPWLKPEEYSPSFIPRYGIMIDNKEFEGLYDIYTKSLKDGTELQCIRSMRENTFTLPEQAISSHVKLWSDNRYIREADHGKELLGHGYKIALAAVTAKDSSLLRLAARYALSLALTPNWHDSFICHFPGSNFEHKAFVASLCSFESALILDLAWDLFTEPGRQLILRRIGESGLGTINWIIWKHGEKPEEIFKMNQLSWFTPGRMMGYLMLEKEFKRVRPYTDLCYQDLVESINEVILPDGGYLEGPHYFTTIAKDGGLSIWLYARGRNKDFLEMVPPVLKKTADFIEVFESTDREKDVIPVSDSQSTVEIDYPLYMAVLLPLSRWTALYRKISKRTGGHPDSVMGELLDKHIPAEYPELRSFINLPYMGVLTSQRYIGPDVVKILIPGNHKYCHHTHEDKGSFILEWAGDTFAMDPGIGNYADPRSILMTMCDRHNMLLPWGTKQRAAPVHPLPHSVKPKGLGDETQFQASMDLAPGWEKYYRSWNREWNSPSPDRLTITDEYELNEGEGVQFLWNTALPVSLDGNIVIIEGKKGRVEIKVPEKTLPSVEELPGSYIHNRIVFKKTGRKGRIVVEVKITHKD